MQLYLSSEDPEVLEQAQDYLQKTLKAGAWKQEEESAVNRRTFKINLQDEAAKELLKRLLSLSPKLDIQATLICDLEGRDHSFWRSTHYQSAVDENGKRYLEASSSTGWA